MEIKNLTKKYSTKTVFEDFNCYFDKGKITAIMGESGVGKTTLLNVIAGLTDFIGEINNIGKISYIFQNDRLVPNLTVEENLKIINIGIDVEEELQKVDMVNAINMFPSELSAGMSRRVAILRAINFKSQTLLMDEPFINLDYYLKYKLMDTIKKYHEDTNNTILFVTHDIGEAVYLSDRIIIIDKNQKITEINNINKDTEKEILNVFLKK